jgi:choice-of-anchor B domain-containing protein
MCAILPDYLTIQSHGHMISRNRQYALLVIALIGAGCSGGNNGNTTAAPPPPPSPPPPPPGLSTGPDSCSGGIAGDFACSGLSLRKRVSNDAMGGGDGNDIWGWVDALTGNEYALMGLTNGTAFVDVTDPDNPVFLGHLATNTTAADWRDIKVYLAHAFVVADGAGAHGMQVFDLTRLRGVASPQTFTADAVYGDFGNAHNLAINEATGYAYAAGTNNCGGGLHMIDISIPINPMFAGCYTTTNIHDTQCVLYQGPDADHMGQEICVNSNKTNDVLEEHHLGIADVTNKSATTTISSTNYPDAGFAHQGWLTEDHRYFLMGDELDELDFTVPTRTHVFDLTDLDAPVYVYAYEGANASIDHNLYILGNRVFQANYTSGVRILEFVNLSNMDLIEIAFFDTFPGSDAAIFDGLWSVYPFLPSGNIIASDRSNGLFILTMQ